MKRTDFTKLRQAEWQDGCRLHTHTSCSPVVLTSREEDALSQYILLLLKVLYQSGLPVSGVGEHHLRADDAPWQVNPHMYTPWEHTTSTTTVIFKNEHQ